MKYDFDRNSPAPQDTFSQTGGQRSRHTAHVGGRHGFPHGAARRRSAAAAGRARHIRLCAGAAGLLRCGREVVRTASRLAHGAGVDTPYDGCDSGAFGHSEGPDATGRQDSGADARLQPLLHLDPQQRMPDGGKRPDLPRRRYTSAADLGRKAARSYEVKAMLLCNPHNPAGRVQFAGGAAQDPAKSVCTTASSSWPTKFTANWVMPGFRYTPFASLSEEVPHKFGHLLLPSKAYSLIGLQVANIIAAGEAICAQKSKGVTHQRDGRNRSLGVRCADRRHDRGAEWLDALNSTCTPTTFSCGSTSRSTCHTAPYCRWKAPIWCGRLPGRRTGDPDELAERLLAEKGRLRRIRGTMYGAAGAGFIRLNIACPHAARQESLIGCGRCSGTEIAKKGSMAIFATTIGNVSKPVIPAISLPKLKTERL